MDEQQRRAFASDHSVQSNAIGVDETAGECIAKSRRQVRRAGNGAGAAWRRQTRLRICLSERGNRNASRGGCREEYASSWVGRMVAHDGSPFGRQHMDLSNLLDY